MTMENAYQIVFVSLMYFSFSNLPIRRLDRQEKPFLTGPALHVWRTFGSEGEENFGVMFHSEAQYENHDSKVTVNHLITRPKMPSDYFWAASPMCCSNDLCGTRRRVEWTHASMSVGGHTLPPHPLILKWLHPPPTHTHHHHTTTTTPVFPSSPVSSTVSGDEV